MTISVAMDSWKLPFFRRHLDEAGLRYVQRPANCACHPDVTILLVECESAVALAPIVEAAQREARRSKMH